MKKDKKMILKSVGQKDFLARKRGEKLPSPKVFKDKTKYIRTRDKKAEIYRLEELD